MLGILVHLVESTLVGVCLTAFSLVLFSLAALLRLLPSLAAFCRLCLRAFLVISYHLYRLILRRANPFVQSYAGIDLLSGHFRITSCLLLSIFGGLLVTLLSGFSYRWCLGVALTHGLLLGLAWDEFENPDGLQLGAKVK